MAIGGIFVEVILIFVLVFVVVFAILQKSKILGDSKQQIDALVAISFSLLLVFVYGPQKSIIANIIPWVAVGLVVLLAFFLLYSFVGGDMANLPNWVKYAVMGLALLFVGSLVFYLTDISSLFNSLMGEGSGDYIIGFVMIAVVIAGIAWVVKSTSSS